MKRSSALAVLVVALSVQSAFADPDSPAAPSTSGGEADAPTGAPGNITPGTTSPRSAAPAAPPEDTISPEDLRDVFAEDRHSKDASTGESPTGTVRIGGYRDSDQTSVWRALGMVGQTWGHWLLAGSFTADAVTSASVDVRSSPALSAVDVVTSASGRSSTSGGVMTDTRYQGTAAAGWKDTSGHAVNATTAVATETDYASISGGFNGSYDVHDRNATLLGGFTLTDNWVSSVIDKGLHHKMFAAAYSAGLALVLTRSDAIRLRYDGKRSDGYLASPYRNVRFGSWAAQLGEQQITFMNTIGSAAGLPERLPDSRTSHAAVIEWVHALAPGIGLHPELRLGHDSWAIESLTAAVDLRIARRSWRMQAGYRFYLQSPAGFFENKYTQAPTMYTYYTSDKELGAQTGHLFKLDLALALTDADGPSDTRMMLDFQVDAAHYTYAGFTLLPSRESVFAAIGLSWEL